MWLGDWHAARHVRLQIEMGSTEPIFFRLIGGLTEMIRILFANILAVLLIGCASPYMRDNSPASKELDSQTGALKYLPATMEYGGDIAYLYANKDNRIVFEYKDIRLGLDSKGPVTGGDSFKLLPLGDDVLALWWSHQGAKNLYASKVSIKENSHSLPSIVNTDHGVLSEYSVVSSAGNQNIGALYLDERRRGYRAYFSFSSDGGTRWSDPDMELDDFTDTATGTVREPQLIKTRDKWVAVWSEVQQIEGRSQYQIVERISSDEGRSWGDVRVIHRPEGYLSSLRVASFGGELVVFADELGRGIIALASTGNGSDWGPAQAVLGSAVMPRTDSAANSGVRVALSGTKAHVVWAQDRAEKKSEIWYSAFDLTTKKWVGQGRRVDVKEHDYSMSRSARIISFSHDPRKLAIVWRDWRDIKPNIYASFSVDDGVVWSQPIPLFEPGNEPAGFVDIREHVGNIYLIAELLQTSNSEAGKVVFRKILNSNGELLVSQFPQQANEQLQDRLRARVDSLWKLRKDGFYEQAYEYFDYAYRSLNTKRSYVEHAGNIRYISTTIKSLAMNGNEAKVTMKVKYEVGSGTFSNGKPIKVEPVEVEVNNDWVYIKDEWYLVYAPAFGKPLLQY